MPLTTWFYYLCNSGSILIDFSSCTGYIFLLCRPGNVWLDVSKWNLYIFRCCMFLYFYILYLYLSNIYYIYNPSQVTASWVCLSLWTEELPGLPLFLSHPFIRCPKNLTSLVAQTVKNLPAMQETCVRSLGRKDPLEEGIATHSSILAWRIPWTEEPGGLQSMVLQELDTTQ